MSLFCLNKTNQYDLWCNFWDREGRNKVTPKTVLLFLCLPWSQTKLNPPCINLCQCSACANYVAQMYTIHSCILSLPSSPSLVVGSVRMPLCHTALHCAALRFTITWSRAKQCDALHHVCTFRYQAVVVLDTIAECRVQQSRVRYSMLFIGIFTGPYLGAPSL